MLPNRNIIVYFIIQNDNNEIHWKYIIWVENSITLVALFGKKCPSDEQFFSLRVFSP